MFCWLAGGGYTIGTVLSPVDAPAVAVPTHCDNDACVPLDPKDTEGHHICFPSTKKGMLCDADVKGGNLHAVYLVIVRKYNQQLSN